MTYALILGVMAAVLGVKGYTMFSLGRLRRELHDLRGVDEQITDKINNLDATRTQLERDQRDLLSDILKRENQKDDLLVAIQKFGAVPIEEPEVQADYRPSSATPEPDEGEAADKPGLTDEATDGGGDDAKTGIDDSVSDAGTRILIVDDNDDLRDLLSQAFGREYAVDQAADGLEALRLVLKENRKYDVVLTDLNMPHVDGVTFLDHLPEDTRAIVMSAYFDRPEFAKMAAHPRVFRTIEKPFKLGTVKDAVRSLLERRATSVESPADPPSVD